MDDFVTGMYPGALVGRALESDVSYHVGAVEGEGLEPDPEVHGVVIGLPFGCRYVQASRLQCNAMQETRLVSERVEAGNPFSFNLHITYES